VEARREKRRRRRRRREGAGQQGELPAGRDFNTTCTDGAAQAHKGQLPTLWPETARR